MKRHVHTLHSSLTRRQFLARHGVMLGGMTATWLLPERLALAIATDSVVDSAVPVISEDVGDLGDVAFPLHVSENHRYLVDSKDKPFFVLGDTPWFLQKLKLEDMRLVLDDRMDKGFNTLFLEILDDSAMPSRDAYGNFAFEPEKDITKPTEAYWRYADTVMEEASRRGFFVIMSDLWFGAGKGLWMHYIQPDSAKVYGHFLGKRYARFKNLMWMHCGDRNPDQNLAL